MIMLQMRAPIAEKITSGREKGTLNCLWLIPPRLLTFLNLRLFVEHWLPECIVEEPDHVDGPHEGQEDQSSWKERPQELISSGKYETSRLTPTLEIPLAQVQFPVIRYPRQVHGKGPVLFPSRSSRIAEIFFREICFVYKSRRDSSTMSLDSYWLSFSISDSLSSSHRHAFLFHRLLINALIG